MDIVQHLFPFSIQIIVARFGNGLDAVYDDKCRRAVFKPGKFFFQLNMVIAGRLIHCDEIKRTDLPVLRRKTRRDDAKGQQNGEYPFFHDVFHKKTNNGN